MISIGNLTFGGTGKLRLCYLSKYLQEVQKVPVVLTRGYKGEFENSDGIILEKKFKANPVEYWDELVDRKKIKKGAVIVGKKKSKLKKIFSSSEADVVLLDDGYQHIQIFRSFNVALFDATLPIDRYKVAPLVTLEKV